ncbi:MAG TPA: polyprenyl diphosphate synthase, partial [Gemmatimonadaceae bacterium]|nr:polyprenyl diphosphate synthase [Gemmatimonadaceae bacterium]
LLTETRRLAEHGARLTILGRRDRLSNGMRELIARAEAETANGTVLDLRIAIDYSARDEIARAARALVERGAPITREAIDAALGTAPSLDLVIRTGRERRLSDFLLWESAYAELHFTDVMWPDFTAAHLERAVADFHSRTRRFGALAAS